MAQDEALRKLEELSSLMEEDGIEISNLSTWDIDFLKNMSINYDRYRNDELELTEKQIFQIDRIYDEHIGDY